MYRQPSNRNQRSKGIKVKHVLQICLLLAVCFWLVYQVKHSQDKKKEFDVNDAKSSLSRGNGAFIKLGRKDIHPGVEETTIKYEKHDEAAEEEEDVEDNKLEEDETEDKKDKEKEDEGMGGGDDEIDEHRQEKLETEVDRDGGFVDDEKEKEDGEENETQEKDSEDGNGQMEKESSVEDTNHDGDDTSTHEAREEHYKADDASSAVTHHTQMVGTENENEHDENLNEQPENVLEQEYRENNDEETDIWEKRKELELEAGEVARDDKQSIITNSETKENSLGNSENGSSPNNTVTKGSSDHSETSNSSTENHNLSLPNVTESKSDLGRGEEILAEGTSLEGSNLKAIDLEQDKSSTLDVDGSHLGSNSKGPNETEDSESNSEKLSEASDNTESSTENNGVIKDEKSDISDGADETLQPEKIENPEEIQQDSIDLSDSSNSLEEKDIRMDLDTLPEIQIEGTNNEDAAVE